MFRECSGCLQGSQGVRGLRVAILTRYAGVARLETLAKPARLVRLAGLWASPRCDRASRQTPEVRDKALPEPNSVREKTMILWGLLGVATF